MLIDVDVKLDLFDLLGGGDFTLSLLILLLLVTKFAEIHNAHDGRRSPFRDHHQILSRGGGQLLGFRVRNHSELFAIDTDQQNGRQLDGPIVTFQQLSYSSTLLSRENSSCRRPPAAAT